MNLETASIIAFFIGIVLLAYRDRKNIEIKKGVIFRRTKRGERSIHRIARKHDKLLKWFGNASILVAFGVSLVGLFFLVKMTYSMTTGPEMGPSLKVILPELPVEGICTRAFCVPFWFWIISIFVIITPHELSHGLLMALERIRIKSLGFIVFLIFPGAFVEPDEKGFKASKPSSKMRISAVGSIANLLIWLALMGIVFGLGRLGSAMFDEKGVDFMDLIPDMPAEDVGLSGTIIRINDRNVSDVYDLDSILGSIDPGEEIIVITTEGKYELKTVENPDNASKSFIGIGNVSTKFEYSSSFKTLGDPSKGVKAFSWTTQLFMWIAFLDINVAIINLLPFLPFDGGVLWSALFEKLGGKESRKLILILSLLTYSLLFLNLFGLGTITRLLT